MSQHLRLPISLAPDGTFRTVTEDSPEEITQNVRVILRTRIGERLATPDFGTPDPTFAGFDAAAAMDLVSDQEPRAELAVVEQVIDSAGLQTTDLSVRRRES